MTRKVILILVASLVTAVLIGWAIVKLPRRATRVPPPAPAAAPAPLTPVIDGRKIKARLFFVSEDGSRLTSVEHEVPYAERTEMQARRILEAQFAPAAPPLVSAIPQGTTVRAVFLTPDGTAFVDVSGLATIGQARRIKHHPPRGAFRGEHQWCRGGPELHVRAPERGASRREAAERRRQSPRSSGAIRRSAASYGARTACARN